MRASRILPRIWRIARGGVACGFALYSNPSTTASSHRTTTCDLAVPGTVTPGPPGSVVLIDTPAIRVLLSIIRDKHADHATFERASRRLLTILSEEALAQVPGVRSVDVSTPCGVYKGLVRPPLSDIVAISILRSGDALLEAMRLLEPGLSTGKFLIQRDESSRLKEAHLIYTKLPAELGPSTRAVLVLDPMLATGGSAILAVRELLARGVHEERIVFVNVVSCPEGISRLQEQFPRIKIVTTAIDNGLNGNCYIVPGLGDFGDRYYGTTSC